MKLQLTWRRVLYFVLTIPVAFLLVWGLQVAGIAGSCGQNGDWSACNGPSGGGGSPPPCIPSWTPHTSGSDAWVQVQQNHEYDDNVTVQGYRTDSCSGTSYSLDRVFARTQGLEYCDATILGVQTDWDSGNTNSPSGINPWTLDGSGGYASSGCLTGHWIVGYTQGGVVDTETGLSVNLDPQGWFAIPPGNGTIEGDAHCLVLWLPPQMDDPCTIINSGGGFP